MIVEWTLHTRRKSNLWILIISLKLTIFGKKNTDSTLSDKFRLSLLVNVSYWYILCCCFEFQRTLICFCSHKNFTFRVLMWANNYLITMFVLRKYLSYRFSKVTNLVNSKKPVNLLTMCQSVVISGLNNVAR